MFYIVYDLHELNRTVETYYKVWRMYPIHVVVKRMKYIEIEINTQHNAVLDMNTYALVVDNRRRRIGRTAIVWIKMASYYNRNIT